MAASPAKSPLAQAPATDDPVGPLSEAFIAEKAAELEALKADIAALREHVGQQQMRRAAEMHREREHRIEAVLAELLPVPDTLRNPGPAPAAPKPYTPAPLARQNSRPAFNSAAGPATYRAAPRAAAPAPPNMVTPRSSRPTSAPPQSIPASARRATPASRTASVPKHAVPPKAKEPATKLAPKAAELLAAMHESPYSRPSRLAAQVATAHDAMKSAV